MAYLAPSCIYVIEIRTLVTQPQAGLCFYIADDILLIMNKLGTAGNKTYLKILRNILELPNDDEALFEAIVNAPFHDRAKAVHLNLGLLQMTLVNTKTNMVDRIALSDTEQAHGAVDISVLPFKSIHVPFDYEKNLIVKAIRSGKAQSTSDWQYLFIPALTPEEARFNQAGAGVACSFVYPLIGAGDGGALTFSFYQPIEFIQAEIQEFMQMYTTLAAQYLSSPKRKLL